MIYDPSELTNNILSTPLPLIDICHFLGGNKYPAIRLHFSSSDYPPPKTNEDMSSDLAIKCSGWADLCRDLMTAAHHAGYGIICNSSQRSVLGGGMIVWYILSKNKNIFYGGY